jgi:hypothetical protein
MFRLSDLQIAVIYACSVSVFGVSAESMQCSYDTKGKCPNYSHANAGPFIFTGRTKGT